MYIPTTTKDVSMIIHRLIINFFLFMEVLSFSLAKVRIIREISKEYFEVVDAEDAAVAYLAALAGGKYLYVPPAAVEVVSQ